MNGVGLREKLLVAESVTPELERRYRERLRALTERRLTPVQRGSHIFGLVVGIALAARFVQLFVQNRAEGRPLAIVGLAVGFAFSVGWAFAAAAVLRSGTDRFFTHRLARTWLVVVFTGLLAGLMLWAGLEARDAAQGIRLILFGLVFWCTMGLPFLVAQLVRGSELHVRADVLRLELALAERGERGEPREARP